MKAVFYHKQDTKYNDEPGKKYHFPRSYLSRVKQTLDDWVIFYGPIPSRKSRYYYGLGLVSKIRADIQLEKHFFADITDYIDFDDYVDYRHDGGFENALVDINGRVNAGRAQQAVRIISDVEFNKIVDAGLSKVDQWPERDDLSGFSEEPQQAFEIDRPIIQQISNRKWRDKKFQQNIRNIYDRRCSFTGLRLINGRGRPEIQAAHIRPVASKGTDSVQNGIALSATVHWMFDTGLLSLQDDFKILQSRQINSDISHILYKDGYAKMPKQTYLQPHPENLRWHREYIFKD